MANFNNCLWFGGWSSKQDIEDYFYWQEDLIFEEDFLVVNKNLNFTNLSSAIVIIRQHGFFGLIIRNLLDYDINNKEQWFISYMNKSSLLQILNQNNYFENLTQEEYDEVLQKIEDNDI